MKECWWLSCLLLLLLLSIVTVLYNKRKLSDTMALRTLDWSVYGFEWSVSGNTCDCFACRWHCYFLCCALYYPAMWPNLTSLFVYHVDITLIIHTNTRLLEHLDRRSYILATWTMNILFGVLSLLSITGSVAMCIIWVRKKRKKKREKKKGSLMKEINHVITPCNSISGHILRFFH